ncbi:MAG: very short patch repair endonuclease [Chloroflexota bacterium]|nr:very short patch repair endonuclease [Chloroflexota bacterium]
MTDNLTPEQRSYCMSRIRSKDMTPEMAVRSMTHRMGFRFRLHRKDLPGRPDLTFARHRAVIFVHGCFWHWHPDPVCPIAGLPKSNVEYWTPKLTRTRERDHRHLSELREFGWRTLVVWECELRSLDLVMDRVRRFLLAEANGRNPRNTEPW